MNHKPKCYTQLEREGLDYLIQAHADSSAIGFSGPQELIKKGYNMVCNFYPKVHVPKLTEVHDSLSFIISTEENFRKTVEKYLFLNTMLTFENDDEAQANAEKLSHSFITDNLTRRVFIPRSNGGLSLQWGEFSVDYPALKG